MFRVKYFSSRFLPVLAIVFCLSSVTGFIFFNPTQANAQVITSTSQVTTGCLEKTSPCTAAEDAFLNGQTATPNSDANNQGQAGQLMNQGANAANPAKQYEPSCSLISPSGWFQNCIAIPLMSWLGSWFLTMGGAMLVFAGVIFDFLVQHVIVDFGGTLTSLGLIAPITTGWTLFRDISNIIIIGMFTFIAISIILGNKEYGQKKLIARVLIVAVLINFSLLFAKIIIDAGNFGASQVYQAVAQNEGAGSSGTTFDITGAFLKPMGITSVWDTQTLVKTFGLTTGSSMQAFAFGLVGGMFLFMLAIVLLYGCFLIASRAVLLIILMITASAAFASYLIPKYSGGEYGWSGWWKSLINASVFAPLLMIFLGITLMVMKGAQSITNSLVAGQTTIGGVVSGAMTTPGNALVGSGWQVIILYILGIGLLFVSFRLSSSFASSIGGFNFAQAIAASPITQGSRLAGFVGRRFGVGSWAYGKEETASAEAKQARTSATRARASADLHEIAGNKGLSDFAKKQAERLDRLASSKDRTAAQFGKIANSRMNPMNTGVAKAVTKAVGLTGVAAGASAKGEESAAATIKRRAEEAAKQASRVAVSEDDKKKIREEAQRNIETLQKGQRETAEKASKDAKETADILKEAVTKEKNTDSDHQVAKADVETKVKAKETTEKDHKEFVKTLTEQIRAETDAGRDAADKKAELDAHNTKHQTALTEQDDRIKEARARLATIDEKIETKKFTVTKDGETTEGIWKEADEKSGKLKQALDDFNKKAPEIKKAYVESAVAHLTAGAEEVTKEIARKQGSVLERFAGSITGDNERVATAATKKFRSKNSNAAKLRELVKDDVKEHEDPKPAEGGEKH